MHFFVDILIAFLSGLLVPIGTTHQYVHLTPHLRAGQKARRQLKNRRATFYRRRIRIPRNVKRQKCVIHFRSEVSRPRRVTKTQPNSKCRIHTIYGVPDYTISALRACVLL